MTLDNRTPAEKAYDDLKSGAAYVKADITCPKCGIGGHPANGHYCDSCGAQLASSAWSAIQAITDDPNDGGIALADEADRLLATVPIIRSRDAQHRQQRLDAIIDYILDAPEAEQARMLELMESLDRRLNATHTAPLNG